MMYEKAVDYLRNVDGKDRILVVNHWDMDGSSSAAIVSKIIEEVRGDPPEFVKIPENRRHNVGKSEERLVEEKDINKLIVLDMSIPPERMTELKERHSLDILVIDHHKFHDYDEAIVVNPRRENPQAYIPASKLCNDISKKFGLDLDWIAGFGIIQDFGASTAMELFEKLSRQYPKYFPSEISQYNLAKKCRYGTCSSVMNVKPYKNTSKCAERALEVLMEARGLKYVESHPAYEELYRYYEEVSDEIERIKKSFDDEKEVYKDLKVVVYVFESPHHINSSIATQISIDRKDWIFITGRKHKGEINVSSRCQSGRIDLGEVLRRSMPEKASDLAEAGGHRKAAGASIGYEFFDEFKENVLRNISEEQEE